LAAAVAPALSHASKSALAKHAHSPDADARFSSLRLARPRSLAHASARARALARSLAPRRANARAARTPRRAQAAPTSPSTPAWTRIGLLVLGRLVTGVACGGSTVVVPMYLGEVSPAHLRGMLGTAFQLTCVIAMTLAQVRARGRDVTATDRRRCDAWRGPS
jgi:hypothetical protein